MIECVYRIKEILRSCVLNHVSPMLESIIWLFIMYRAICECFGNCHRVIVSLLFRH